MNNQREIFGIVRQVLALLLHTLRSQEIAVIRRNRNMMHNRRNPMRVNRNNVRGNQERNRQQARNQQRDYTNIRKYNR